MDKTQSFWVRKNMTKAFPCHAFVVQTDLLGHGPTHSFLLGQHWTMLSHACACTQSTVHSTGVCHNGDLPARSLPKTTDILLFCALSSLSCMLFFLLKIDHGRCIVDVFWPCIYRYLSCTQSAADGAGGPLSTDEDEELSIIQALSGTHNKWLICAICWQWKLAYGRLWLIG